MAKEDRKKAPQFTSPVATFLYPKLKDVDYGTEKYPIKDGAFSVQFLLKAKDPETKAFLAKLQPIYEEAIAEGKAKFAELKAETRKKLKQVTEIPFFTEVLDETTEKPTGDIRLRAKMTYSGITKKGPKAGQKWTRKPVLFDASGSRIVNVPEIWSGTKGRVAFEVTPYFVEGKAEAGISLRLLGVQILELVQGGERSADSLGLSAAEGYAHDDSAFGNSSNADASDKTDDDDRTEGDDF